MDLIPIPIEASQGSLGIAPCRILWYDITIANIDHSVKLPGFGVQLQINRAIKFSAQAGLHSYNE